MFESIVLTVAVVVAFLIVWAAAWTLVVVSDARDDARRDIQGAKKGYPPVFFNARDYGRVTGWVYTRGYASRH